MTSSTWRFETDSELLGCGVDVESVERFEAFSPDDPHPMPFVFTKQEIDHARNSADTAELLCLSFSGKEALFKAAGKPYNYNECEILPHLDKHALFTTCEVALSPRLKQALHISYALFCATKRASLRSEVVSTVYLFGKEPS